MSSELREGFREVLRDPALLLIEIAWRWSFGVLAMVVCAVVALLTAKGMRITPPGVGSLSRMDPIQAAQSIASTLVAIGAVVIRTALVAGFLLAFCWVVLNALGRRATLLRGALAPGASLRACFAIALARAGITLGAVAAWVVAGLLAGAVLALSSTTARPNLFLTLPILVPAFLMIACAWSLANWYLSLAPLFAEAGWSACVSNAWRFVKLQRDEVLEITIATSAIRFVLLVAAIGLSVAVGAVITNIQILGFDLLVIALLYFFAADFVSMARLAAFARLRNCDAERLSTELEINTATLFAPEGLRPVSN
jgi:hypothetical protein